MGTFISPEAVTVHTLRCDLSGIYNFWGLLGLALGARERERTTNYCLGFLSMFGSLIRLLWRVFGLTEEGYELVHRGDNKDEAYCGIYLGDAEDGMGSASGWTEHWDASAMVSRDGLFVPAEHFRQNTLILPRYHNNEPLLPRPPSLPLIAVCQSLGHPMQARADNPPMLFNPQHLAIQQNRPTLDIPLTPPLSSSPPTSPLNQATVNPHSEPAIGELPAAHNSHHVVQNSSHVANMANAIPPQASPRAQLRQSVMSLPSRGLFEWEIPAEDIHLDILLGEGGFGRVYRGLWQGTPVAAKLLTVQHLTDRHIDDFVCEVTVLSKMRHPNVLLFLGAATLPPHLCIVTELMSRSLFSAIHDPSVQLPLRLVVKLMVRGEIASFVFCFLGVVVVGGGGFWTE
jgi:hypothetical protein